MLSILGFRKCLLIINTLLKQRKIKNLEFESFLDSDVPLDKAINLCVGQSSRAFIYIQVNPFSYKMEKAVWYFLFLTFL